YHATIAELEVDDPFARLPYVLGMVLVIHRTRGDHDAALEWIGRCERESERLGLSWPIRQFRLQRAPLLAQPGDLAAAEVGGARAGRRTGAAGWIAVYEREAEAHAALLRGDGTAIEAARRAIATARIAPVSWHALATVEMAAILAESGGIAEALDAVD